MFFYSKFLPLEVFALNILYLVPYCPTSIRVRPHNLIKALAGTGHSVTLATLWEDSYERDFLQVFRDLGVDVIALPLKRTRMLGNISTALFSSYPIQARYSWHPGLLAEIKKRLSTNPRCWDVIHVEHLRGICYGLELKKIVGRLPRPVPIIWDSVDCISYLFDQTVSGSLSRSGRWIARIELPSTRHLESAVLGKFERILVTSAKDKEAFCKLSQSLVNLRDPKNRTPRIEIIPNGVDLNYYFPLKISLISDIITFSGKLSYHSNHTAAMILATQIMPLIWEHRPGVKLVLAGKDPHHSLRRLSESEKRIQVTGSVLDLRQYIQNATISIIPMTYGAGLQNKVLEAMACGVPVIASDVAVSAISAVDGQDFLQARSIKEYADKAVYLLDRPAERQRLASNARKYVEENHDWTIIVDQLVGTYMDANGYTRH